MLEPFEALNAGRPYRDTIKPFNFLLTAHVRPFGHPSGVQPERFHLIAPQAGADRWLKGKWIDRYSHERFAITTSGDAGGPGRARVLRHGEVFAEYAGHRERKSLAPDGSVCAQATRGILLRRPVLAGKAVYVGKEGNFLDEALAGLFHDEDEVTTTYAVAGRDRWQAEMLPRIRARPTAELMAETGRDRSTVKRWKAGVLPHPADRERLWLIRLLERLS